MKISEGFGLFEIGGVPYVLPYGQNIADHKKGFRLNESGLILWNGIQKGLNRDQLVDKLAYFYEADLCERKQLETDVDDFLNKLSFYGALYETVSNTVEKKRVFTIGHIRVNINSSDELLYDYFKTFESSETSTIDLDITVKTDIPMVTENGQLLLRNRELCVLKNNDKYIFIFPEAKQIKEAHLSVDGKQAFLYVRMPYTEGLRSDLFHAIRLIYLYRAQLEEMFVVHSASILYDGRLWLFSAPSGVGKSTHTNLWHETFQTPVINGDLNMLAIEDERPVVHGIPWCGTSEIFDANSYPLGGVVFLKRGDTNVCEEMELNEQALSLMHRMISPAWTKEMLEKNLSFAEKVVGKVPVCRLYCTKEIGAVKTLKKWIDSKEKQLK